MSSDLLEDCVDHLDNTVLLTMFAGGLLEMTVMDRIKEDDIEARGKLANFCFPASENGWYNAKNLADALNHWIEHSKAIKGS